MIVLGIDPGAAGAGYCAWNTDPGLASVGPLYIGPEPPSMQVDVAVVESGFVGKMGRKAMWGLGFSAGSALAWMHAEHAFKFVCNLQCFTIRPDGKSGWRAALPPRPDLPPARRFTQFDGLPGEVIVARLRIRYGLMDLSRHTEHEVEAIGIAEAAAAILARPKASQRKALVKVKR